MSYGFDMNHVARDSAWQATFDDIGRPLASTTFVVLDLETSGSAPSTGAGITEIGAVKVRGGEVIATFQTLVNPEGEIPAFITVLTGITNAMVLEAPKIGQALPSFLEFLGSPEDSVLVAHNAPFDIGFLKAAAAQLHYPWPKYPIVDTARLARQILLRDEVPNCKLATLARFFNTVTTPNHRALDDAQATVDVLHGLLERLGSFGVTTLDELTSFSTRLTNAQKNKKHLASNIPAAPGVYIFRGPQNEALYIGTSRNLKSRVRTYFTSGETRKRIFEMLALADHVDIIVCATIIEAQIRELRLINERRPSYNRRSKGQERATWARLKGKPEPRYQSVKGTATLDIDSEWIGPFGGGEEVTLGISAIHHSLTSAADFRHRDVRPIVLHMTSKMNALALDEQYEQAATVRNQLGAFLRGVSRGTRIRALTQLPELIAARPCVSGSEEIVCIRYGRLVGSAVSKSPTTFQMTVESLRHASEVLEASDQVLPHSTYEEVEKLLAFLEMEEVHLVSITGEWTLPLYGAPGAQFALERLRNRDQESANFWLSSTQRSNN